MGYRNVSALKMDEHDELEQQGQKERERATFFCFTKKKKRSPKADAQFVMYERWAFKNGILCRLYAWIWLWLH